MLTKNGDNDNTPPFLCVGESGQVRGKGSIIVWDESDPESLITGMDFSEFTPRGGGWWQREAEIETVEGIISVSASDSVLFEGTGSINQSMIWDESGNASLVSFMYYNVYPSSVTVVTADKTYTGDVWTVTTDICTDLGLDSDKWNQKNRFYAEPQQSYENQWGIGTHQAAGTMFGVPVTYNVEITDNPVLTLEVADVAIEEGSITSCGEMVTLEDGSRQYVNYEGYNVWPQAVTITTAKGSSTGNLDEVREWLMSTYGVGWNAVSGHEISTGQYEEAWGLGVHQATLSFMGKTAQFNVEVISSE